MPKEELYDVLYDWEPENDDDLRLVAGETLTVLEQNEHGWWYGVRTKSDGTLRRGFFPKNYVKKRPVVEPPKPPPRPVPSAMESRTLPQTPPQPQHKRQEEKQPQLHPPSASRKKVHENPQYQVTNKDPQERGNSTGVSQVSSPQAAQSGRSSERTSKPAARSDLRKAASGSQKTSQQGSAKKQQRMGKHALHSLQAFDELVHRGYTLEIDDFSSSSSGKHDDYSGQTSHGNSSSGNGSGSSGKGLEVRKGMKVRLKCAAMVWDAAYTLTREFANGMVNFVVGNGQVTLGMEAAVQRLRVGQRAVVTCGPSMAYGSAGNPPAVPPHAHVIFRIEIVSAGPAAEPAAASGAATSPGKTSSRLGFPTEAITAVDPASLPNASVPYSSSDGGNDSHYTHQHTKHTQKGVSRRMNAGSEDNGSSSSRHGSSPSCAPAAEEDEDQERERTRTMFGAGAVPTQRRSGGGSSSNKAGRSHSQHQRQQQQRQQQTFIAADPAERSRRSSDYKEGGALPVSASQVQHYQVSSRPMRSSSGPAGIPATTAASRQLSGNRLEHKSNSARSPAGASRSAASYSAGPPTTGMDVTDFKLQQQQLTDDDYYSQSSQGEFGESYSLSLNNDILDP